MKDTAKKIAYLKGLMESMEDSPEAKILKGVLEVLGDLDDGMDALDDKLVDLNDYVESIDDDLSAMEDGDFDGEDDDFDDEDYDDDFEIDDDPRSDRVHVVHIAPGGEEMLDGRLCTGCKRLFLISVDDDPKAEYVCPFCGTRMHPEEITIGNTPRIAPAE